MMNGTPDPNAIDPMAQPMPDPAMEQAAPAAPADPSIAIRKRLAQQAQNYQEKIDALAAENAALKEKVGGTHSGEQMVPLSAIGEISRQMTEQAKQAAAQEQQQRFIAQKVNDYTAKVTAAGEDDPELKELITKGNDLSPVLPFLADQAAKLPNIVAVTKQLLKNPIDYDILMAANSPAEALKHLKDMSNEIDGRMGMPTQKKYEPAEKLSGSVAAGEDLSEYVNKYKGRRSK